MSYFTFLRLLGFTLLLPFSATAQSPGHIDGIPQDCQQNRWSNSGEQFCEVREYTVPARSHTSVDGKANGGIAFYGSERNDIKIVAMVQAHGGNLQEAEAIATQVRILTDGGQIRAEGPRSRRNTWWSVSYQLYVPSTSNLDARTTNGGISAASVQGKMNFRATNGGIRLIDVGGDIDAETTNGGVSASLSGKRWSGSGLNLRTTNGGVDLKIPRDYNARLIFETMNGGMRVDFPITVQGNIGSKSKIDSKVGSGGATIRASTTNGGVRISQR